MFQGAVQRGLAFGVLLGLGLQAPQFFLGLALGGLGLELELRGLLLGLLGPAGFFLQTLAGGEQGGFALLCLLLLQALDLLFGLAAGRFGGFHPVGQLAGFLAGGFGLLADFLGLGLGGLAGLLGHQGLAALGRVQHRHREIGLGHGEGVLVEATLEDVAIEAVLGEQEGRGGAFAAVVADQHVFPFGIQSVELEAQHRQGDVDRAFHAPGHEFVVAAHVDEQGAGGDLLLDGGLVDRGGEWFGQQFEELVLFQAHEHAVLEHGHRGVALAAGDQGFLAETVAHGEDGKLDLVQFRGRPAGDGAAAGMDDVVVVVALALPDDRVALAEGDLFEVHQQGLDVLGRQLEEGAGLEETHHPGGFVITAQFLDLDQAGVLVLGEDFEQIPVDEQQFAGGLGLGRAGARNFRFDGIRQRVVAPGLELAGLGAAGGLQGHGAREQVDDALVPFPLAKQGAAGGKFLDGGLGGQFLELVLAQIAQRIQPLEQADGDFVGTGSGHER